MGTRITSAFDTHLSLTFAGEKRAILRCRKNKIFFSQGEPADAVFFIQKGRVKLTVISKKGKVAVTAILGDGEFFGEGSLAGQRVRVSTATALVESFIIRVEKGGIEGFIRNEPYFAQLFLKHLLTRNVRMEEDLVDQLFNSSELRLARILLLLAGFGKEPTPEPLVSHISQETLAAMIGTTRSRVSFFMNRFRKMGLIEYDGQLTVKGSLLNVVLQAKTDVNTEKWLSLAASE